MDRASMASAGSLRLAAVIATIGKSQPQVSAPFPLGEDLFQGTAHGFAIRRSAGKDAERAEHGRVIAVAFGKGLRAVLMCQVDAVFGGQCGKFGADPVPLGLAGQSGALAPALRDTECVVPVFEIEGG